MIKAVFFDIDGTLVSFRTHKVPASAVKAIGHLREAGIKVFIATGRHLQVINNLGDLPFDGYVTLNGSYCYAGRDKVIYRKGINVEDVAALIDYQDHVDKFPCIFVRDRDMFINYANERVEEVLRLLDFPRPPVVDMQEALDSEVFQLIAFFCADQESRIMPELPHCESTRWNPLFTDIVPAGGSKRIGMEKVLDYFGLCPQEVMAFGDGGNDLPMLRYAGVGIAMGNAAADVKNAADFITRSVDDDGVAYALRAFGLI